MAEILTTEDSYHCMASERLAGQRADNVQMVPSAAAARRLAKGWSPYPPFNVPGREPYRVESPPGERSGYWESRTKENSAAPTVSSRSLVGGT